jgi:hypothetical protein
MKSRQLEILLYLLDVKKTTCAALAQRFEVSRRTILRDLDKLSAMGVPVWTQSGYEGGVFLSPDYRFDRSFFTAEEIGDIILAFHLADHLGQRQGQQSALKKLELLVPELAFLKELDLREYLKLELLPKPVNIQTGVCRSIHEGLDDEVLIQITVEDCVHTVAPLYYILRPDGLYLYCADQGQMAAFPVEQIRSCSRTEIEFDRERLLEQAP